MERMSNEQLEKRIQSFMKRKMEQFPNLADQPDTPRQNSLSLISRISAAGHYVSHLHGPRHASLS